MASVSPKIEIINHFDSLINRIDVDIEEYIKKRKNYKVLRYNNCYRVENRFLQDIEYRKKCKFAIDIFNLSEKIEKNNGSVDSWSELTKTVDYLNQVRQKTIDELRKAQENAVNNLTPNSESFKDINEMKSRLFADKFYFQVAYKPIDTYYQGAWIFSVFTFVADFYLSPSDIELLQKLINRDEYAVEKQIKESSLILDEKMILIGSIKEYFLGNLVTRKFPNHMIHIRKEDLFDIQQIKLSYSVNRVDLSSSLIGLSKLERFDLESFEDQQKINLERLTSLKYLSLNVHSIDCIVLGNLNSLRTLSIGGQLTNEMFATIFDRCPNIEELWLFGNFPNDVNLDGLVCLKELSLSGYKTDRFNYDNFKNVYNRLHKLSIALPCLSIDDSFFGHDFANLSELEIHLTPIVSKLEKKMFDGFPSLQSLKLAECMISTIEPDAFSGLTNLKLLDLRRNDALKLDSKMFVPLGNLEHLDLSCNCLKHFDIGILDHIPQIKVVNLNNNSIWNQQQILNHVKNSNITVSFSNSY